MKYIKLFEAFINERVKAPKALEELIKGNTTKWEGIKMSKDLADHYLTWLRTSPYGKKYGSDLPLDAVIKASFNWGIERGLDPGLKVELNALRDSIKESINEATLEITGHAYNIWNDKKIQRQLDPIRFKIVGNVNGVMTLSGEDKELDKVRAIFGIKESVNEAKAFDADVTKMIKQIKSGMGWIDPEFVEETWENISDTIDFSLVQKELYKRLIDAKLLAWPNPDDEEKMGVPVRRLQDVVKESFLDEYEPSEWDDDITEAKVPENWIPFDLDYEVSKNRPLWLLMDSKLSSKDIAAIKAASPYAMKVGFFEVEIAMDKKPSIQSDPYDFSRVGGSKNAWVVTIKK